jgi:hypothetical protein
MIFETWEILTTDVRNLLFSVSALYLRFNNEPLVFSSASSSLIIKVKPPKARMICRFLNSILYIVLSALLCP